MSPSVFLFKKCPKALYGKKRENSIHFRVKIIYILEDEIKTAMNLDSLLACMGYMYRYISYTRENSTRLIMQLFYYRQMVLRRTNVVIVSEL